MVVFDALKELAIKLYKRNPQEWKKDGHESLEMAVESMTGDLFSDVDDKVNVECIRLTFDEDFQGDRVKTFIVGLETMVLASWLIRTKYNSNGELFLLSTGGTEEINLSFERLFGKMINAQDLMAQIMADRTHRQIKNVIQQIATAFIPIL